MGDVVVSRSFTTTTVPTLDQVCLILDQTATELNRELDAAGYSAPVSTGDIIATEWLRNINEMGAAALVLGTLPITAITPESEDAGANRGQLYQGFYNRALTTIQEQRLRASRRRQRLGAVFSGSQSDSDNNRKLPLFKRSLTDFPATRRLTE